MGWESCTPHTYYTGLFNLADNLFIGEFCHIICLYKLCLFHLAVTFDYDGVHHIANRNPARFDCFHCS